MSDYHRRNADARRDAEELREKRSAYNQAMRTGGMVFAPLKCHSCGTDLVDRYHEGKYCSSTGCAVCNHSFVD